MGSGMVRMFKNWIEGRRDSLVSNVLLYKYKDLDLDHKNPHEKLGVVAPQSRGGRDRWIPAAHWPATLAKSISFRFTERSCLKK